MNQCTKSGWVFCLALMITIWLLPSVCLANPGVFYAKDLLAWVAFGELAPLLLETALLRRWFSLSYIEALVCAIIANVVSFVLPMFAHITPDGELLGSMSEIMHGELPPGVHSYFGFGAILLVSVAFLIAFAMIVETPVYLLIIPWHKRGPWLRAIPRLLLLNLISYPIYFGLVWLGVWLYALQMSQVAV